MFNCRIAASLLFLLMCGCAQQQETPLPSAATPSHRTMEQAKKIYADLCASCHGQQARGGVGPDLTVSHFKYGRQQSEIEKSIMSGRAGGMPAFDRHLKPDEAAALATYVLSLQ